MRLQLTERSRPITVTLSWLMALWAALQLVLGVLPSSPMGPDHPLDAEAWSAPFDASGVVYDEDEAHEDELNEEEDDEGKLGPSVRRLVIFQRSAPTMERETSTSGPMRAARLDLTRAARGPPRA